MAFSQGLVLGCAVVLLSSSRLLAAPLDPSGVWLVEDKTARIRIEVCRLADKHVCSYIVWSKDNGGQSQDVNNPDPKKRDRPVLGSQLILGFSPEDDHYAGKLYSAENGKFYDTQVRRKDDTHLSMKGCVLRYLCGSQTWTRVDDVQGQIQLSRNGRDRLFNVAAGQLTGPTDAANGPRADAEWAQLKMGATRKHLKKKENL